MDGNEFEIDDFERTLREYADRFYMKPSERVWKSIYNDLHPGSKWPSFAVALFMIFTLFWIGNNNRTIPKTELSTPEKMVTPANPGISGQTITSIQSLDVRDQSKIASSSISAVGASVTNPDETSIGNHAFNNSLRQVINSNKLNRSVETNDAIDQNEFSAFGNRQITAKSSGIPANGLPAIMKTVEPGKVHVFDNLQNGRLSQADEDGADDLISDIINKNRQNKKRLTWKYYFSPMITSVTFGGVNLNDSKSTIAYTPVSGHQMNIADRLGFVVGGNAYYSLREGISVYTGFHLGHTGYNIFGRASRPDIATLTLVDKDGEMYKKAYISRFSNGNEGLKADITNFNWQFSIPVGVKYDLISGNKLKISMISGVEPFLVMGSKAFLLSGDAGSYVEDPSLVRKVNLNANLGIVTTLEGKKTSWEIGPNFRYQMMSTYNNTYPVKEHFVNYGIHLAVGVKK